MKATNYGDEDEKKFKASDFIVLLIIGSLLVIDFLPYNHTMEIINPQFLYLSIVNIFLGIYCYLTKKINWSGDLSILKKNYVASTYVLFLILCAISIITAKNTSLVITKTTQLLIIFCLFVNLCIIVKDKFYLIYKIIFIVCLSAFFQSGQEFYKFICDAQNKSIIDALVSLKGNTGNINILAASMTIKVPFLLIAITHFSNLKRIFLCFTLLMVTLVIFLTGARTPYLSLLSIFILYFIYYFKENSFSKSSVTRSTLLILPIIGSIIIANIFFANSKDNTRYVSLQNRVKQINTQDGSASARINFWKNVVKISKKNPVLGIGLGNYQVESIPYERLTANDSNLSLHTHNDFLEITAETGILNGIVYFSLFVFILIVNLKRVLKSEDKMVKTIAILSILVAIVYGFDSLFNFPMYRPTMQIFFCLLLVFTVCNTIYITESTKKTNIAGISVFFIIFNIALCYSASVINKASNLEYLIQTDDINANISGVLNGDEVLKRMPKYPNVFSTSEPFYEYAGIYYLREKKYDKALNCFSKADKINPYLGRTSFYKNIMSIERGNSDSAYIYSKQAFYLRPRNSNFYRTSTQLAATKSDTLEILKEHQLVTTYRNSPEAWITAANALENANFNRNSLTSFMNKGVKQFPKDSTLLQRKNAFLITTYIMEGQNFETQGNLSKALESYQKGLKIDFKSVYILQNLGFYYYNLSQYQKAIVYFKKALSNPGLYNGKTEFYMGNCYQKMNDRLNSCKYFEIAHSKNFANAKIKIDEFCK